MHSSSAKVWLASLLFTASQFHLSQSLTLLEALDTNAQFSQFKALVQEDDAVLELLTGAQAKTLFVPDNNALAEQNVLTMSIPERQTFVKYHVLNGTFKEEDLNLAGGKTVPTYLVAKEQVLLSGDPNVVFTSKFGDNGLRKESEAITIFSGVGGESKMTDMNLEFDGGVIHGVDKAFALPQTCTETAKAAQLNSLLTSLEKTKLTEFVDTTDRITCFAPLDSAFDAAGNPEDTLSTADLAKALQHHTLQGSFVGYSDLFENGGEYMTLSGSKILVTKQDGNILVNGVKVVKANVITKNGVAHVLESILPMRNGSTPTNTSIPSGTGRPTATGEPDDTGAAVGRISGFSGVVGAVVIGVALWGLL